MFINFQEKKQKKLKGSIGGRRCVLLDDSDRLIFHIIGHDDDFLPNFIAPIQPTASKPVETERKKFCFKLPQPNIERVEKSVDELKKENLQLQNELLKRDVYLRTLEIYEKEKKLLVPPSEFTQNYYEATDDENSVIYYGLNDPIKEEKTDEINDDHYFAGI